jgi:heterodisulfide reductase subunit A
MMTEQDAPKVGVFVCHCGKNIGAVVDVKRVCESAKDLKDVVYVKDNIYTCAEPGQNEIKKAIKELGLNRVVVAACSPKLHEPTFRRCVEEAGLNKYLFEMVNIREHCSWVHSNDLEGATKKASDLVKSGVAKARLLKPLEDVTVPVKNEALVIGGGVAGCQAALDLANIGFKVHLVEREQSIGGIMAQLDKTLPTLDCSICILGPKLVDVGKHPNIDLLTNTELKSCDGYIGNFEVTVETKPRYVNMEKCDGCGACVDVCPVVLPNKYDMNLKPRKAVYSSFPQAIPMKFNIDIDDCIKCGLCMKACDKHAINFNQTPTTKKLKVGTIIVACGAEPFNALTKKEYGYGRYENVMTSMEFERVICASGPTAGVLLRKDGTHAKKVAFIQCVGSRDEKCGNPYCSSFCCTASIKQAMLIKEHDPDAEITIFYMDMRAHGKGYEDLYSRARETGIMFVRGRVGEVRGLPGKKNLVVVAEDTLTGGVIEHEVDLVVLALGFDQGDNTSELSRMLHIPLDSHGFFMEAHPKLRPVDTAIDGIFVAGSAAQPRDIKDSVTSASAAASRATIPMAAGKVDIEGITASVVHPEKCTACGSCVKRCPYGAPTINVAKKKAEIVEALCKGCGTCVADCPLDALDQKHFTEEQLLAQVDALLEEEPENKIISFNCNWCSYAGADLAGVSRFIYPTNVRIVRVMCSGRVSKRMILRAFEKGAGMVLVAPCHPADCHYISGNKWAEDRIEKRLKPALQNYGIDPKRLRFFYVSAAEGIVYSKLIAEMTKELKENIGTWKNQKPKLPVKKKPEG